MEPVVLRWHHSILAERHFVSPWQASWKGLLAALEQGYVDAVPVRAPPARCGKRSSLKKVSFDPLLELAFAGGPSSQLVKIVMPADALCSWDDKPWKLRERRRKPVRFPVQVHDPLDCGFTSPASLSFVQQHAIVALRGETEQPDWALSMQEHFAPPVPDAGDPQISPSSNPSESGRFTPQSIERQSSHSTSPSDTLQSVLIYPRDEPAVHAQVHWTHIEDVLNEIADILHRPRRDLVNAYEVSYRMPHMAQHVLPLV